MTKRRLVVLYATETGTAEEVAERVAREARNRHFDVVVSAVDAYERVFQTLNVFECHLTQAGRSR